MKYWNAPLKLLTQNNNMLKRNLIPGSEWLYCKLYTGTTSADKILVEIIKPYTERLKSLGLITDCFFIRYTDPKFHIRLRLKLTDVNSFNGVMTEFRDFFETSYSNSLLLDIVFDTYKREVERYGEESIETVEQLFCADSVTVIDLIEQLRENGDSDKDRWLLSMILIDDLLDAVGYNLEEKSNFLSMISTNFNNEFGITSSKYTKPLNDKYRDNRKSIEEILAREGIYSQYELIFTQRKNAIIPYIETLKTMEGINMKDLLPSIIHMTMNRVFRSNNRLCEMVVYYLMNKCYASKVAQSKLNQ